MDLHPRLALNAIVTPQLTFAEDLALWRELGLRRVGLLAAKIAAAGSDTVRREIAAAQLGLSAIIAGPFTLEDSSAWGQERADLIAMIDLAADLGGAVVYSTPGKGLFDDWDGNARRYAEAVAPCLAHARARGIPLAFEPSLRTSFSFVHNLRDALDLARIAGTQVVVDIGNGYAERDHRATVRQIAAEIPLVQISDVAIGTPSKPGSGERGLPGTGELPLEDYVCAAHEGGYTGPFEIEYLGSAEVDRPALRKSLIETSAMLDRVVGL